MILTKKYTYYLFTKRNILCSDPYYSNSFCRMQSICAVRKTRFSIIVTCGEILNYLNTFSQTDKQKR